jgi:hypothetical protein
MKNNEQGNSCPGLLSSILILFALYFGGSFLYERSVKSATREMLRDNLGKNVVVEQVYLQGYAFFDTVRSGDALVNNNGDTSLMEIKVRGNGLWHPLYIEIPGTEVFKLKFNNFLN